MRIFLTSVFIVIAFTVGWLFGSLMGVAGFIPSAIFGAGMGMCIATVWDS